MSFFINLKLLEQILWIKAVLNLKYRLNQFLKGNAGASCGLQMEEKYSLIKAGSLQRVSENTKIFPFSKK